MKANKNKNQDRIEERGKIKARKSGFDFKELVEAVGTLNQPFRESAFGMALIGIVSLALFLYGAKQHNDLYNLMIVEGTQNLINAALGPNPGVSREGFDILERIFQEKNIDLIDQVRVLETIETKISKYMEIQALNDNEGPKLDQILRELRRLQDVKRAQL